MKRLVYLSLIMIVLGMVFPVTAAETTLPNGANLDVFVTTPETCTEFLIPAGQDTIPIDVSGTASVGLGDPDATLVYVVDVSGSTDIGGGTGCSPILGCEKIFIIALNHAAADSGSVSDVGSVVFADTAATADMDGAGGEQLLTPPNSGSINLPTVVNSMFSVFGGNGGVNQFTPKSVGISTNFAAALQQALVVVQASTKGHKIVVFASDGVSNLGTIADFNAAVSALSAENAKIYSVAIGTDSSCTGGLAGTLQAMADATGGTCTAVADPGLLPEIIPDLISTELTSLALAVDGGAPATLPDADIDPDIPAAGAVAITYLTSIPALGPGDHVISVTATGEDVTAVPRTVTDEVTIHLYQITLNPPVMDNELGSPGQTHTVTATLLGPLGGLAPVSGREITFSILTGPNAGGSGICDPVDCTTDANGEVTFAYTAAQGLAGLGTDTIQASVTLNDPNGETGTVTAVKNWLDTTPPVPDCTETVNPAGKKVPPAGSTTLPGVKGGQNEDGFYLLTATDAVDPVPQIFVQDMGSGEVFGPFTSGTNIKYTEDSATLPVQKSIGGPNSAVAWHIKGTGDAAVFAVDASGNTADAVACLVPPLPK